MGGSLESNGYIVSLRKGGECYIIDPGYEPIKFIKYIEEEKLKLKGIILTHHHHDHVGGAAKISDRLNCPVMMSFADSLIYRGKTDIILNDGDIIRLEDTMLKVIETPGHTHGSLCIEVPESKIVFTGDTIFDTDLGRTDLEDGSEREMINTCRSIISTWPDSYTIYPGHDGSATMKQIRIYNEEFLQYTEER